MELCETSRRRRRRPYRIIERWQSRAIRLLNNVQAHSRVHSGRRGVISRSVSQSRAYDKDGK